MAVASLAGVFPDGCPTVHDNLFRRLIVINPCLVGLTALQDGTNVESDRWGLGRGSSVRAVATRPH